MSWTEFARSFRVWQLTRRAGYDVSETVLSNVFLPPILLCYPSLRKEAASDNPKGIWSAPCPPRLQDSSPNFGRNANGFYEDHEPIDEAMCLPCAVHGAGGCPRSEGDGDGAVDGCQP